MPQLGQSLFPAFKERDFLIHWVSVPGTSDAEMARTTTAVSHELTAVPGIRSFGGHIGQALLGEEVAGVNFGENWVSLDPSADYDATVAAIDKITAQHPGLFHEVQTYLDERIEEVLTGSKEAIVVRIYGEDLAMLREKSREILDLLAGIDGVVDAHSDISTDVPQIEVTVKLAEAEKYGLKPGDVRRAAATLVAGEEVGDIFRTGKAYDVVVWSPPATRGNVTDIEQLPIDTPSGKQVLLGTWPRSPWSPTRTRSTARVTRGGSTWAPTSRAVTSARWSSDLKTKLAGVKFDRGYHAEVLGE